MNLLYAIYTVQFGRITYIFNKDPFWPFRQR